MCRTTTFMKRFRENDIRSRSHKTLAHEKVLQYIQTFKYMTYKDNVTSINCDRHPFIFDDTIERNSLK